MSILSTIKDMFSGEGGVVGKIIDTAKDYFPPSMTDQEKAELELALTKASREHEVEMIKLATEAEKEFNDRIAELEGTASDLKSLPIVGRLMLFLRGAQRPIWGFGTLAMDFMVFAGKWTIIAGSMAETSFFIINLLVLGFLFGERTVLNLSPLIERLVGKYTKND